jgi:hypothetical protein
LRVNPSAKIGAPGANQLAMFPHNRLMSNG